MIFQKRPMRTELIFVILSRIRIKCEVLHEQNMFNLPPPTIFLLTVPRLILCCSSFVRRGFIWCVCLVIGCSSFLPPWLGMFVFRNCGISSVLFFMFVLLERFNLIYKVFYHASLIASGSPYLNRDNVLYLDKILTYCKILKPVKSI